MVDWRLFDRDRSTKKKIPIIPEVRGNFSQKQQ